MNFIFDSIDNLFITKGWIIDEKNEHIRSYTLKHYELDKFIIEYLPYREIVKTIIPLRNTSFWAYIPFENLYDYMYEHLSNYHTKK
tara:strand:+ start:143 stop:400 length:258 start_codon:yes stop_codon:yes gene_type:complete